MSFVGLDTTVTTSIRHDARDTHSSLPIRVINPCDVNQAIINGRKWIRDHASTGKLAVVDHHEGRTNIPLIKWLVINGQLVGVLNETTAESLQV